MVGRSHDSRQIFTIESTTDYKPFQEIDAFFATVHITLQYFLPGTVAEEFHVRFLTLRSKTPAEDGKFLMCISPIISIKNYPSYKRGGPDCLPLWCGTRFNYRASPQHTDRDLAIAVLRKMECYLVEILSSDKDSMMATARSALEKCMLWTEMSQEMLNPSPRCEVWWYDVLLYSIRQALMEEDPVAAAAATTDKDIIVSYLRLAKSGNV